MYKCLYDKLKDKCNATASAIYATYHLTVEKRWYDAQNCSISECCRCLFCIFYCLFYFSPISDFTKVIKRLPLLLLLLHV